MRFPGVPLRLWLWTWALALGAVCAVLILYL